MGFNTVSLTLNDCSHEIERSPVLGRVFGLAMGSGRGSDHEINGLRILPSQHADCDQLVIAGGNRITPLAYFRGLDHTPEAVLRALARDLGYSLRKKRKRDAAQAGVARTTKAD